ncbi:hypothetical protein V2J09_017068 [Rumex salicifolius]
MIRVEDTLKKKRVWIRMNVPGIMKKAIGLRIVLRPRNGTEKIRVLDSGANFHMTPHRKWFSRFSKFEG